MFRIFDLAMFEEDINQLLNDPKLKLLQLNVACSEETAYTPVTLRFQQCEENQERKYKRYLNRFIASSEAYEVIDDLLADKKNRLIKMDTFPTKEGTVIVLDYQVKRER